MGRDSRPLAKLRHSASPPEHDRILLANWSSWSVLDGAASDWSPGALALGPAEQPDPATQDGFANRIRPFSGDRLHVAGYDGRRPASGSQNRPRKCVSENEAPEMSWHELREGPSLRAYIRSSIGPFAGIGKGSRSLETHLAWLVSGEWFQETFSRGKRLAAR
jgi:hypothetical protein